MADPLASWMWMSLTAPPPPPLTQDSHVFLNMDKLDKSAIVHGNVQLSVPLDANVEVDNVNPTRKDKKSGDQVNFIFREDKESAVEEAGNEDSAPSHDSDGFEGIQHAAMTVPKKDRPWIWRVHPYIREKDEEAYNPKIVSIGPFHRGKPALQSMEEIKEMYMKLLLDRSPQNNTRQNYSRVVGSYEDRARKQYTEVINMRSKPFIRMLVLDGCFIIEYLLRNYFQERQIHQDHMVNMGWNLGPLQRDLMLLENQIPFFILEALFRATIISASRYGGMSDGAAPPSLMEIALRFLRLDRLPENKRPKADKVHHLLHLQYMCLIPSVSPRVAVPLSGPSSILLYPLRKVIALWSLLIYGLLYVVLIKCLGERGEYLPWNYNMKMGESSTVAIPCATELHKFGVTFERNQLVEDHDSYLNITFSDHGVLAMPRYVVGPTTVSQFRNFIAFEKCHFIGNYFTEYAILMDNIIDSESDVVILRKYGILESTLGTDKQVVKIFNRLLDGTYISHAPETFDMTPSDESPWVRNRILLLFEDVNKFCNIPQHRWRASLRSSHLRSPWAIVTLFAVIFGVTAALIQMVFTVKRPNK